ncbi:putative translation initiation factor eIF-2B subunit gamma [Hypsizygus marmoreus]|uniref:Translation initiation factor eIF2B subunit gamma n=1 Tax=Hypsizygus marmoreus TaxID=39966 RepID=A0A369J8U7_HYPMA|nr:putative translation initiation factor eIF-2B subunit gamma [Hypsizygus marmoreus]
MDIERSSVDLVKREFLAVLLAGFGNELLPLTSDHGDEPCPKALLPVVNKPMIDYVLNWIEQSGIRDVLLICPAIHRPTLYHHIHSGTSVAPSSLNIDLQTYDESQDTSVGTCTLLRHFSSRIPEDFVLVPCDFIPPPSLPLSLLLDKFRVDAIFDGSIATTCWFAAHRPEKGSFPDEWGPSPPPVPIVWDEPTGTLLHIDTPDDLDRNPEEIELRMALLSRYPRTKLSSSFQDSHVYVCRRSVLDVLHEKRHFDSIREEFVPWLLKVHYQRTKREKYARFLNPITNTTSQTLALKHSTMLSRHQNNVSHDSIGLHTKDPSVSGPTSPMEADGDYGDSNSFRVGVIIHRADAGFAIRVNTIPSFLEMNRRLLSQTTYSLPTDPKNRSLIDQKAQISSDTMIGDSTQVSERTTIKKSVIGRHCVIGKMVKIVGCVLLDHCVIEDGAKLDGCILGKNTKVGAKAELSRCVTQAGYEVSAGESVKGEKLDISDWTANPEDGDDEGSDEETGEGTDDDDDDGDDESD